MKCGLYLCLLVISIISFFPEAAAAAPRTAVPYHGMRMMKKDVFYVRSIGFAAGAGGSSVFDIRCNAAVDPRSVLLSDIYVDGSRIPPESVLIFNKAGTELRLTVPASSGIRHSGGAVQLELRGVSDFAGTELSRSVFGGLARGATYAFRMPQEGAQ